MTDIRWEDPPPDGRYDGKWSTFRQELIANPGRWAVMVDSNDPTKRTTGHLAAIKSSSEGWRGYRWEATSRTVDGEVRLYVRCLGPVDGAS